MDAIAAYLENMQLLATIAGLLAGFSFAVVFQLLQPNEKTTMGTVTLIIFLIASSCFVVCVFNATFMVIGSNTLISNQASSQENGTTPKITVKEDLPITLHLAAAMATLSLLAGLLCFIGGIGCSGWLHSVGVGIVSTAIAGASFLLTMGIFFLMLLQVE